MTASPGRSAAAHAAERETLSPFAAVGLVELNSEAELQTRVDRKYILPRRALTAVLAHLAADDTAGGIRVLEIGGERALRYASQYFDTPALDSYYGAASGRRRRFKVRARTYVDSGGSFLEVKTRGGRSATVKNRVPVAGDTLDDDAVDYATTLLAEAGVPRAETLASSLQPVLATQYRRATLLLAAPLGGDASRGTIDTELTWVSRDGRVLTLPDSVIVETKSGRRAGALDRALWHHGIRPISISKYGTGMAALHPALPAHKWRPALTRHFAGGTLSRAA